MKWWHVVGYTDLDGRAVPLVAMPAVQGDMVFNDEAFPHPLWIWSVEAYAGDALEAGRAAYEEQNPQVRHLARRA